MGAWHEIVKMKVAVAVVAAVSVTGIAAAGAVVSTGSEPSVDDPGSTTTTTLAVDDPTTTTTTTLAEPVPVDEPTTTPATPDAADPGVPAPCETHGQRVSRVAHETPPGPGHGAAVSAAAHDHVGECGTDEGEDVSPPPATPTVSDDDEAEAGEHAPEPEAPESDGGHHGESDGGHGHD